MDKRRIGQEPLVVVDLVELPELGPELTRSGLKVGEQRREGLQLVEEDKGLFDASRLLLERQEEGELRRELKVSPVTETSKLVRLNPLSWRSPILSTLTFDKPA